MPAPLSVDLRRRVVAAWREFGLSREELAVRFSIGPATAYRIVRRYRETGDVTPAPNLGAVSLRLLGPTELEGLRRLVAVRPDRTIAELRDLLAEEVGVDVSPATISRGLSRLGLTRKKRLLKLRNATQTG
jgi:transposase